MTSKSSLNHTFRTVWNQALGAMVAVAEIASGAGKGSGAAGVSRGASSVSRRAGTPLNLGALALGVALAWNPALANPTGAVAVVGQAVLSNPAANQLVVTTQNGAGLNHSVINWQSFSIPSGSSTYFAQPNASSTSINRVVTDNPSAIFGTLGSNGKLVLVNPSGITVGAGAVVDTAGFTASALAMTDADALAGRLRFGNGQAATGSIDVQGSILARSGDVVLIAPQISTGKDALIQANGATVLAAGRQVYITGRGLEGIVLQVQAPEDQAVNLGQLKGDAVGIFAGTLKHSGSIQANALSVEGGKVVLKAVDMADVSGQIRAQKLQGQGGDVVVTADKTVLRETAVIDTSNSASGGSIRVGGGFHGEDAEVSNAKRTVVMAGASLKADATDNGNGGRVVVWSDEATGFGGNISAKGGANGGDGGNVEVSGKQSLSFQGMVDTTAARGKSGWLLLDPDFINIGTTADLNGDGTLGDDVTGDIPNTYNAGYGTYITATQVSNLLNSGNLSLSAFSTINVSAPIQKTSGATTTLTLTAQGITTTSAIGASGSALNLVINGGGNGVNVGAINSNGGNVSITSSSAGVNLNGSINTGSGALTTNGYGTVSQTSGTVTAASWTAGSTVGNLSLNSAANNVGTARLNTSGNVDFANAASSYNFSGGGVQLTLTGSGAVTIDQATSFSTASITSSNGITLTADLTVAGFMSLFTTNSQISQSGGKFTSGGNNINAGSGDISLTSATNSPGTTQLTGGHISLVSGDALNVVSITQAANKNLFLKSGASSTLTVPVGNIDTGTGQLSLISGTAFTTPGDLRGSDVLLQSQSGALTVPNNITASGGLTLAGTSVNQTAGTLLVGGTTTVGAGSGAVSLAQAGNDFTGAVGVTGGSVSLKDANALVLGAGSTTSLGVTASGNVSQTGALTSGSLALNAGAGSVTLTNAGNAIGSLSVNTSGAASVVNGSSSAINVGSINASSFNLASGGDIAVNGSIAVSGGGDAVVLRTPGYLNVGYGGAINAGNGRWLLYFARDPDAAQDNFSFGALAFKQYNTAYGNAVLGSGNGAVYNNTHAATLTGTLTGEVKKVYDGSTSIGLSGASVGSVSSNVSGDTATLNLSGATGTLSDPNVGINKLVSVSNATVTAQDANGLPVYGYQLAGVSGNIGTVKAAIPIISLTGERYYDGTNIVNANIFTLSGLANGETLTLTGAGTIGDKNVGTNKAVTLGTLSLGNGNALASNYTLDGGSFTANILPLTLSGITGVTALNKTYDGTTKASINTSNAVLSGVLAGDSVSLLSANASFADKNAGTHKAVTITGLNLGGADAQNYKFDAASLASSLGTFADISKATISAISGLSVNNKVYDGTTAATLSTTTAPTLSGAITGDDLSVSVASASFANKNAGDNKTVSLSGIALAGKDAQNYTLSAPTTASTSANIAKATITGITGVAGVNKTYDGTTAASIDTSKEVLTGAVAGDNLTLANLQASFADKNAGPNKTINLSGFVLGGSDAANYTLSFASATTSASINQAVLQLSGISVADKVYDGNTSATITTANAKLGGVIGNDNVTLAGFGQALFADKNVGTSKAVNVAGLQLSGSDAANYALTGNIAASASITPLAQVAWVGGASGNWSNAANWAGGAIPDGSNVLAVSIPAVAGGGSGSITFDSNASLQNLTSARPLVLTSGSLNVANAISLGSYSQSGGTLSGGGMTVANSFSQSGGSINLTGALNATQASGALQVSNISAPSITLSASSGAINESGVLTTASLSANANGGINLASAGNKISAISASNSGSGDITVVNSVPLNISTLSNTAGSVSVDNTGGVVTGQQTVTAKGNVTIAAHSPLTIGTGGVQAGGDIVLTAGASAAQDDLIINGPVNSSGGSVKLNAGDNLQQNANVSAPAGSVTATVAGLISGAGVATGKEVNYTSGGVTVPPPGSASVTVIQTLVTTFSDSFKQDQSPAADASGAATGGGSTQDPAGSKDKKKDDLVVAADSNVCK